MRDVEIVERKGRGNPVGGVIPPSRPMTLEAAGGKNVVTHVGKSYSIVAHQIARELVANWSRTAAISPQRRAY